jgi:hypothetical protein
MKTFRMGLRLGLLAGITAAVVLALQSRRRSQDDARHATGVHGDWPAVTRRPGAPPSPPVGDHHPHGRVAVPVEAAAMGAPPAVADPARRADPEPEVPEPRERLDRPDPHPGSLPHLERAAPAPPPPAAKKAVKKMAAAKAAVVKKVGATTAEPVKKAAAAKKASPKKASPVKKAAKRTPGSKPPTPPEA